MENLRYERKWVYKTDPISLILGCNKSNFSFFEEFKKRKINSIYFDDHLKSSIISNLAGIKDRKKIRFRWYGSQDFVGNIFLEQKIKKNLMGKKIIKKININLKIQDKLFLKKLIKISNNFFLSNLIPTAFITYDRNYLRSKINPEIRCTVDSNIRYFKILNSQYVQTNKLYKNECILEIKYPIHSDNDVKKLINAPSYRLQKNSKYLRCFFN
jgi:SPX domain protein involved in polyphosphate accumulation